MKIFSLQIEYIYLFNKISLFLFTWWYFVYRNFSIGRLVYENKFGISVVYSTTRRYIRTYMYIVCMCAECTWLKKKKNASWSIGTQWAFVIVQSLFSIILKYVCVHLYITSHWQLNRYARTYNKYKSVRASEPNSAPASSPLSIFNQPPRRNSPFHIWLLHQAYIQCNAV